MNSSFKSACTTSRYSAGIWILLVSVAGCPQAINTESPSGAALFKLITETDPFEQWSQFPDSQGTLSSSIPHGPNSRVFINDKVVTAVNSAGAVPDGAIIVKENFGVNSSDKVDGLTVMWKVSGFDSQNGDWFWLNVTPDGQIKAEGKVQGCIGCHNWARLNDFVFLHQFDAGG